MLWTTLFSEGIHQFGIREGEGKSPHIPGTTAGPYRGVTLPRPPYFFVCTCPEIPVQRCDHERRLPPGACKEEGCSRQLSGQQQAKRCPDRIRKNRRQANSGAARKISRRGREKISEVLSRFSGVPCAPARAHRGFSGTQDDSSAVVRTPADPAGCNVSSVVRRRAFRPSSAHLVSPPRRGSYLNTLKIWSLPVAKSRSRSAFSSTIARTGRSISTPGVCPNIFSMSVCRACM